MPRLTPFDLVFDQIAPASFPQIRAGLDATGHHPADRDAFLLQREVVTLLRELRPEEGLGEGMDQLMALVHHAYLAWAAGLVTLEGGPELLRPTPAPAPGMGEPSSAWYVQVPERRVWAEVLAGEPPEPLDGCFLYHALDGELRVLGVFGLRPERVGFSVVEVAGPRPTGLARPDGSPLFSTLLAGGSATGLHSLAGAEELLELGWRMRDMALAAGPLPQAV